VVVPGPVVVVPVDVPVVAVLVVVVFVAAGAVVAGVVEAAVPAGLLNKPPVRAGACIVAVSVGFDAPKPENRPPEGTGAGVDDGVADDDCPPSPGKRDFCGVAEDVSV
jgi:hypothetical protein